MQKTAIIIGAGPAGLTAAYEILNKSDIHPVLIERESFVGGISRTVNYNGNRIDIGGHRFFSKSDEVMRMWQELMPIQGRPSKDDQLLERIKQLPSNGKDPEKEDKVFLIRTRISRILYLGKFFDYPISLKLQTFTNLGLKRTFGAGITYIRSQFFKREEKSLEDFMTNRFGSSLYNMFFKDYTYKVWGRDPKDISPDWGAQRIKGLSLSKAILFMLFKPLSKKDLSQKDTETSLSSIFFIPKKVQDSCGKQWLKGSRIKMGIFFIRVKLNRFISKTAEKLNQ
jgi:protoporphyrinogen oxidase